MPTRPRYEIVPVGGMGNQMFQCLLAATVAELVPDLEVSGYRLESWGLTQRSATTAPKSAPMLRGHVVPIQLLARSLRRGVPIRAVTPACRLEHLPSRCEARDLFRDPAQIDFTAEQVSGYGDDAIVVSIRADEILHGKHPDYLPTPVGLIVDVVRQSGRRPVLVGQIADDAYSNAILANLPDAEVVEHHSPMRDFATLRAARHLLLSVSTFSWLAGWLSDAETIHLPVAGLFHPQQRPDIDLLPSNDPRYRFLEIPPGPYRGAPADVDNLLRRTDRALRNADTISAMRRAARHARLRHLCRNELVLRARIARYRIDNGMARIRS